MDAKEMRRLKLEGYTYQYIAEKAGISRQRVHQLLSPPKAIRAFVINKYVGKCADCGIHVGQSGHIHHNSNNEENYSDISELRLLCLSCHRAVHKGMKPKIDNVSPDFPDISLYIANIRKERNEAIIAQFRLGASLRALARMFKLSHTQVANILKEESK